MDCWVRLLCLASVLASLAGCGPAPQPVVFLGPQALAQDGSYERFVAAWETRRARSGCADAPLVHVLADAHTLDQARAVARQAMRERPRLLVSTNGLNAYAVRLEAPEQPHVYVRYALAQGADAGSSTPAQPPQEAGVVLTDELDQKRMSLLLQAFPGVSQVGVLADRYWPEPTQAMRWLAERVEVRLFLADDVDELKRLLQSPAVANVDAFYIPPTYIADIGEAEILAFMRRARRPAMHSSRQEVEAGALMAYSQDTAFVFDTMADLVARVCAGESPATLPVERPRRQVLTVRADFDLGGRRIHPDVLAQADHVLR